MKAVRRTRARLAAAGLAVPLLVLLAGPVRAAPRPAPGGVAVTIGCGRLGGCGISVVVCGSDGRVTEVVRLTGAPPLLPLGRLTVRTGGSCRPPATPPPTPPPTPPAPPTTLPPTGTATPTVPPTTPPATAPPPTAPPGTPPATAPGGSSAPPAASVPASPSAAAPAAPHPAAFAPAATSGPPAAAPPAAGSPAPSAPGTPGPPGSAGYGPPPLAGEPYDRDSGAAARWWLMTLAVVLLPAALAALPYRTVRRRH